MSDVYTGPTPSRRFTIPDGAIRDPHHGGTTLWKFADGKLYTQQMGGQKWQKVNRVSFTPERFVAIARMILEADQ